MKWAPNGDKKEASPAFVGAQFWRGCVRLCSAIYTPQKTGRQWKTHWKLRILGSFALFNPLIFWHPNLVFIVLTLFTFFLFFFCDWRALGQKFGHRCLFSLCIYGAIIEPNGINQYIGVKMFGWLEVFYFWSVCKRGKWAFLQSSIWILT